MKHSRTVVGVLAAGVAVGVVGASAARGSAARASAARSVTLIVSPSESLRNGQLVRLRVSGFGDGVKVFLSECLSAKDAAVPGCGPQTAQQPFLVTNVDGSGTTQFRVSGVASSWPGVDKEEPCADSCVMVASGLNHSRHQAVAVAAIEFAGSGALGADGIGRVRFGLSRRRAMAELRRRFGAPSAEGVNTGCGPRYREVVWGDLVTEFRLGRFSGYRYVRAGYEIVIPHGPSAPAPRGPTAGLATAKGITIGSTLAQVRAAYRPLTSVGTDRWKAANGIVFVDGAKRDPVPPSSRIIEIKSSTCGDY